MKLIPEHGSCFVCGSQNERGMGIRWYSQEDGSIYGKITLDESHQGPPGMSHGGATAALLDEAMGAVVWHNGHQAAAVNLNVDFKKPVPLGVEIEIITRLVEENGKVVHAKGEIRLPGGETAVSSKGIFVEAPQLYEQLLTNS